MIRYLAHSPTEACPRGQPLKDHLEQVSALCAHFCEPFDGEEDGALCGMLHDIGKYSTAFQQRIDGGMQRVDHSTAGAYELYTRKQFPAAMCVAGHHGGLNDLGTKNDMGGSFRGRMTQANMGTLEDYSAWSQEVCIQLPRNNRALPGVAAYYYTKMLFSALTDADWLDTEAYFRNSRYDPPVTDLSALKSKLDARLSKFGLPRGEINLRRSRILNAAKEHGTDAPGLFTMTVPTGGGKTLSSMAFALTHALRHDMRRIFYVIPYCSILEQTQAVFESIFGKENVIAHYSGAEEEALREEADASAFSVENWEAPIILTTAVQFFESIYSNKPGKCRKLHNIARSVIVFDEAQMLPVPYLKPCLAAIGQMAENFGCSAVLCTATQPAVGRLLRELAPVLPVRELCPEPEEMYRAFRRVTYVDEGELSDELLSRQLRQKKQVLCVVNSRRQAQELFRQLEGEEGCFHLSTLMTPFDRRNALEEIRERLRNGQPCRVISTSLIEAGVDVDFPEVYRALAGLDSIIQSGGRCNREGKHSREESLVHIFRTEAKPPRMLEQNLAAAERVLRTTAEPDGPDAVHDYFHMLFYTLKDPGQLDEKEILEDAKNLRFETVARHFHMIDGAECIVYIPGKESDGLLRQLREQGPSRALLRKLGVFSVSVYREYFGSLCAAGMIDQISETTGVLADPTLYSRKLGLPAMAAEQNQGIFI